MNCLPWSPIYSRNHQNLAISLNVAHMIIITEYFDHELLKKKQKNEGPSSPTIPVGIFRCSPESVFKNDMLAF